MNTTPRIEHDLENGGNGENWQKPVEKPVYVFTLLVQSTTEANDTLNSMWKLEMPAERRDQLVKKVRDLFDPILQEQL